MKLVTASSHRFIIRQKKQDRKEQSDIRTSGGVSLVQGWNDDGKDVVSGNRGKGLYD